MKNLTLISLMLMSSAGFAQTGAVPGSASSANIVPGTGIAPGVNPAPSTQLTTPNMAPATRPQVVPAPAPSIPVPQINNNLTTPPSGPVMPNGTYNGGVVR